MTTSEPRPINLPTLTTSDLAGVHRSTGPLAEALQTIPEWTQVAQSLNFLEDHRPAATNVATVDEEVEAYVNQRIEQRQTVDLTDLHDFAERMVTEAATRTAIVRGFHAAARTLVEQLDAAVRDNADALYRHLTAQLQDTIDDARTRGAALDLDAESAIAAGLVEDWKAVGSLRERFLAIRTAAGVLRQRLGWNTQYPEYAELAWCANPHELWEHYRAWKVHGYLIDTNSGQRKTLTPPWPDRRAAMTARDEAEEWLRFLIHTPKAIPWTPAPAEYEQAVEALAPYIAEINTDRRPRTSVEMPAPEPIWVERRPRAKKTRSAA